MRYMNDYDLDHAMRRFSQGRTPNRLALALSVKALADWANNNSDGWAYWPKPARAADKAMALIESRTNAENDEQERTDCTDAEFKAAMRPIKSFLTRQGVPYSEVMA